VRQITDIPSDFLENINNSITQEGKLFSGEDEKFTHDMDLFNKIQELKSLMVEYFIKPDDVACIRKINSILDGIKSILLKTNNNLMKDALCKLCDGLHAVNAEFQQMDIMSVSKDKGKVRIVPYDSRIERRDRVIDMFHAVSSGDIAGFNIIITDDPSLLMENLNDQPILQFALSKNQVDIANIIINKNDRLLRDLDFDRVLDNCEMLEFKLSRDVELLEKLIKLWKLKSRRELYEKLIEKLFEYYVNRIDADYYMKYTGNYNKQISIISMLIYVTKEDRLLRGRLEGILAKKIESLEPISESGGMQSAAKSSLTKHSLLATTPSTSPSSSPDKKKALASEKVRMDMLKFQQAFARVLRTPRGAGL
jgi:hypothetical protein